MRADNYALSEETKRLRDSEQARLTDHAYEEAQRLLVKHRVSLDRLAAQLLERETLSRDELKELLGTIEPESRASETVGTGRALRGRELAPPVASVPCAPAASTISASPSTTSTRRSTRTSASSARELEHRAQVDDQGVEAAAVLVGAGRVELLAPLGDETPVGRFLAKRGPGMHHVAYEVDDVQAELDRLSAAGAELIDAEPREGLFGLQVAFVHPDAVHGVLTEVVSVD